MSGLGLKRALFGAATVALLGYVVLSLLRAPNTPEERMRYAILDAIDEFNDRDLDVLRLFAKGYRDEQTGTDRQQLRDGLQWMLWWNGTDSRFTATLREEQLHIEQLDEQRVRAAVGVVIHRSGEETPWWDLRAVLEFEEFGRRWRATRSTDVNHLERSR